MILGVGGFTFLEGELLNQPVFLFTSLKTIPEVLSPAAVEERPFRAAFRLFPKIGLQPLMLWILKAQSLEVLIRTSKNGLETHSTVDVFCGFGNQGLKPKP